MKPAFHREIEAGNEGDAGAVFVIQTALPQIIAELRMGLEILPVLAVVVHVGQQRDRRFIVAVAQAQRRGDAAQEAQSVAVVVAAGIAEITQQGLLLFFRQIALDVNVLVVQRIGEDGQPAAAGFLQPGDLALVQIEAAAEDQHGVGAAQRMRVGGQLAGIGKAQPDPPAVVVEGKVGLLGQRGVDDQDAGGSQESGPKESRQQNGCCATKDNEEAGLILSRPHSPVSSS